MKNEIYKTLTEIDKECDQELQEINKVFESNNFATDWYEKNIKKIESIRTAGKLAAVENFNARVIDEADKIGTEKTADGKNFKYSIEDVEKFKDELLVKS